MLNLIRMIDNKENKNTNKRMIDKFYVLCVTEGDRSPNPYAYDRNILLIIKKILRKFKKN